MMLKKKIFWPAPNASAIHVNILMMSILTNVYNKYSLNILKAGKSRHSEVKNAYRRKSDSYLSAN